VMEVGVYPHITAPTRVSALSDALRSGRLFVHWRNCHPGLGGFSSGVTRLALSVAVGFLVQAWPRGPVSHSQLLTFPSPTRRPGQSRFRSGCLRPVSQQASLRDRHDAFELGGASTCGQRMSCG
jgi:hypothetical protein